MTEPSEVRWHLRCLLAALLLAGRSLAAEPAAAPEQVVAEAHRNGLGGDYDAAIAQLTALLARPDLEPAMRTRAFEERALARVGRADFEAAIDDFTQAIRLSPRQAGLYFNRARVESDVGRYQAALEDMATIESVADKFEHYHYYRGYMHYEQGNFDHAVTDLTLATSEEPRNAAVFYRRGRALDAQGKTAPAMDDYGAVIALRPEDQSLVISAHRWRGTDSYALGRDQAAIADFTSLLALTGNDADALMRRSYAYASAGRMDLALEDATRLIGTTTESKSLFPWPGVVDATHPIADRIVDRYNAGLRAAGSDPYAYVLRARVLVKLGRKEQAAADYRKALNLIPRGADPALITEAATVTTQ